MADEKNTVETKARRRILLVDDDREIVETMQIALQAAGYEVLIAATETRALPWWNAIIPTWSSWT